MALASNPRDRGDFSIVLICAKKEEAECARDVLDKKWNDKQYGKDPSDNNAYTLGSIGDHHVVIIHMPGMGTDRAAVAKANLTTSFPNIKLALVIGVCGGMPYGPKNEEIILGDVVISDALIRYDIGRQYPQGFERKTDIHDVLGPPTDKILGVIRKLETREERASLQSNTLKYLKEIQEKSSDAKYPSNQKDILYDSVYSHQHRSPQDCDICRKGQDICKVAVKAECEDLKCGEDINMCVRRLRLAASTVPEPAIYFGTMASGNTVMKSGHHRDMLAKEGVLAIEMEGAGVWRYGPTIVIKGVCDYGDSHKRKGWQQYAAATAAACTKAFLLEWAPERRNDYSVETEVNVYFDIPTQRVKTLYGREDELTTIATYFDHSDRKIDRPLMLVLQAMGGQGKSQIALEHCYCIYARHTHHGIFWLDSSSSLTTQQSWIAIARQIDESTMETLPDDDAQVRFAIRTLERWPHRWLIVFDNCDDATTFSTLREKFLPKVGKGDILFTSRHHSLGELGTLIQIPSMSQEAGVQLLLRRYGTETKTDTCITEGVKIVKRLGGLALAIDQASAFMEYRQLPLDQLHTFLPLYLAQRKKVLEHTTRDLWNYMKINGDDEQQTTVSAFTTWEMSFQQFRDMHENQDDVEHFFSLSAFLGSTFIDEAMFRHHLEMHGPVSSWMKLFSGASKKVPCEAAARVASQDDTDTTNSTSKQQTSRLSHLYRKFARRVGRNSHKTAILGRSSSQATEVTASESEDIPWNTDSFWYLIRQALQMSLIQNVSRNAESSEASFLFHPLIRDWLQLRLALDHRQALTREATHILCSSIRVYTTRGSDAIMKTMLLLHTDSLIACDNELFPEKHRLGHDMSTCDDTRWIASFYRDQGQYSASYLLFRGELVTRERMQGKEHPDTLTSMDNLALVLSRQGKYSEAEEMHRQVVEVKERVLGKEHPDTLTSINNLALVLSRQGKYSEAEEIYRQVVEVSERVLGKEHPSTLTSINNLALVLSRQGKYSEAEEMHRQVVEVKERVLGKEHPDTLTSINNLAGVLSDQGKYSEAEEMHRQAVEVSERVLGEEHPDTLTSINNLALVLSRQGKYSEAEKMHRQVVEASERVLGKEHPDTLTSIDNLAGVLSDQGKYSEAEEMHRQVVEASERVLGKEHPDTLRSTNNLARVLSDQGKYSEAEEMHRQVVEVSQRVLGKEHPSTLTSINNLAGVLSDQGKYGEAEEMHRQAVEVRERVLGKEHPSTLTSINNLAGLLGDRGKLAEAERIQLPALRSSLVVLGPQHPTTKVLLGILSEIWEAQGREASEIERMLQNVTGSDPSG